MTDSRYQAAFIFSAILILVPASNQALADDGACRCRCRQSGDWFIAESKNFSVWSHESEEFSTSLAARCEGLRSSIRDAWLPDEFAPWTPRCYVILHANLAEYRSEMGQTLDLAVGCTTLTADGGRIIFRRIDLRGDAADWRENALPHELTHVVLADRFEGKRLPAWLNEGLAICSESSELQRQRLGVLARDPAGVGRTPAQSLLRSENLPARVDPNLAYAASYSIVAFLRDLGGEQRLMEFGERLLVEDCDTALARVYEVEGGAAELELAWRAQLSTDQQLSLARD